MTQFLGTHQNRLDAKGRVSVPAPFRMALRGEDSVARLVLLPSHKHPCIEGWPTQGFAALAATVERMDTFSDERDDLATSLYSDACQVETDKEGRIILPENMKTHAGLRDAVVFMGLGRYFTIWEPAAAEQRRAEARDRTRIRNQTSPSDLPGAKPAGSA